MILSKKKSSNESSLRSLWKEIRSLEFTIPLEEERLINVVHNSCDEYGETIESFIDRVIEFCNIGEDDVFLDLGSGLGSAVLQVALKTKVKESRGIELSKTRCTRSIEVLKKMKELGLSTHVNFIHDTFLNEKLWEGATVVYSWACCFTNLLPQIVELSKKCKTLKYIALHDCSFEKEGINLSLYHLERCYTYEEMLNRHSRYGNDLYIYRKKHPKNYTKM